MIYVARLFGWFIQLICWFLLSVLSSIYIIKPTGLRRGDSATADVDDDGSLINSSGDRDEIHTRALPDGDSRGGCSCHTSRKINRTRWVRVNCALATNGKIKNVFCCRGKILWKIRRTSRTRHRRPPRLKRRESTISQQLSRRLPCSIYAFAVIRVRENLRQYFEKYICSTGWLFDFSSISRWGSANRHLTWRFRTNANIWNHNILHDTRITEEYYS